MKKEYSAMFDKLVPIKSNEELLQAVLSGKADNMNENKKRGRKAIVIPALIAAALCATTIGVSAAYNGDLSAAMSDAMRNIFGKKTESQSADKSFGEFGFEQLQGKELNDIIDCGKYKIEMKGVTADKYTAFLLYDIVFDEDFDYKLADGEEWCALWFQTDYADWVNDFKQGNQPLPGGYSKNEFLSMDGNIAHCYTELTSGIPLQDKTMELISNGLYHGSVNDSNDGEEIDCAVETLDRIKITFDFDTLSSSKTIEPNTKITSDELGNGKIVYLSVSPFGLVMNFVWDDGDKMFEYVHMSNNGHEKWVNALDLKIKFKDGTEKDINDFEEDGASNFVSFRDDHTITQLETSLFPHWKYPINVDEIESITICGKTFTIN